MAAAVTSPLQTSAWALTPCPSHTLQGVDQNISVFRLLNNWILLYSYHFASDDYFLLIFASNK